MDADNWVFTKLGWDVEGKVHSTQLLQDLISQPWVDLRGKTKPSRKVQTLRDFKERLCAPLSMRGEHGTVHSFYQKNHVHKGENFQPPTPLTLHPAGNQRPMAGDRLPVFWGSTEFWNILLSLRSWVKELHFWPLQGKIANNTSHCLICKTKGFEDSFIERERMREIETKAESDIWAKGSLMTRPGLQCCSIT